MSNIYVVVSVILFRGPTKYISYSKIMVYELHIIQPGILQFSAQFSNFEVNGIYMPCMNNTNKKKYYAIK